MKRWPTLKDKPRYDIVEQDDGVITFPGYCRTPDGKYKWIHGLHLSMIEGRHCRRIQLREQSNWDGLAYEIGDIIIPQLIAIRLDQAGLWSTDWPEP